MLSENFLATLLFPRETVQKPKLSLLILSLGIFLTFTYATGSCPCLVLSTLWATPREAEGDINLKWSPKS